MNINNKDLNKELKDLQRLINNFLNGIFEYFKIKDKNNDTVIQDITNNTPKRMSKTYTEELFYGLNKDNFPKLNFFQNTYKYDEPVIIDNISVKSICAHHFLPFIGKARIGYIPNDKIIGLSKIHKIVDFYSRQPQLQEKLTMDIFNCLIDKLETQNVFVEIQSSHMCIEMRGCKNENSMMFTKKYGGILKK